VRGPALLAGRLVAALGLGVTGYVHLHLAATYDGIGQTLTVGDLFRAQGAVAVLAAVLVVAVRRRWAAALALLVGAGSAAATTLSVYLRIPPVGPLPELYEPVWYPEKTLAAVTAGLAALAAAALMTGRDRAR